MNKEIRMDYSNVLSFLSKDEIMGLKEHAIESRKKLVNKTGAGNDYTGWVDLPTNYDKEEFSRIKKAAQKIKEDSDVLIVIGIGGSYLGARAAIEFLKHNFYNNINKEKRKTPEIYFAGNNISTSYINNLIDLIGEKDFSINVCLLYTSEAETVFS